MSAACFCMHVLAGCKSRTEAEYLSALLIHMCSLEMLVLDCGTRSRTERGSGRERGLVFEPLQREVDYASRKTAAGISPSP